jgi:CrcB protein
MSRVWPYLFVGLGGFAGANARLLVARATLSIAQTRFPLATFIINVAGSFLLGVLGALAAARVLPHSDTLRLALGVGFIGAFTTFSTFEFETHALLEEGSVLTAAIYVGASVVVGLLALHAGTMVAKAITNL